MRDIFGYLSIGVILTLYLYYGYKEDYKRNPKGFLKTIVAVPIGVISFIMGLPVILNLMKRWTKEDNDEPKLL